MLDTNICIYILKNKPQKVAEKFKQYRIGDLSISSICVSELYYGSYKSQYVERNISVIEEFLSPLEIIKFDTKASIEYGKIRANLEKNGNIIDANDVFIAAHAKSLSATLITNNVKEFKRVEGLKVENWT
jgi:tRNA(fMet)-specific endonuclease VapC